MKISTTVPQLLAVLLAVIPTACVAAEASPPLNRVSFAVDVSEEVDNDLIVVQFFSEHQSPQQAQSANKVNEDMAWAVATAKAVQGIDVRTLGYRTNPVYDKRRIRAWQTRQSLRLESGDFDAVTALVSTLQARLGIESMNYQVSTARRKAVEARLIDAAVQRFRDRAAAIAGSFGRDAYSLVNANVGTQGSRPPPVAYRGRALAVAADVAEATVEPGRQTITVSVNGTIELSGSR